MIILLLPIVLATSSLHAASGGSDGENLDALNRRAVALLDAGRPDEALKVALHGLPLIGIASRGEQPAAATKYLDILAGLYRTKNRSECAELLLEHSKFITERGVGPSDTRLASVLSNVGLRLVEYGHLDEAEALLNQALAILEASEPANPRLMAKTLRYLCEVQVRREDYVRADQLGSRALELSTAALGSSDLLVGSCAGSLGRVRSRMGDRIAAEALLRKSLEIRIAAFGANHPATAVTWNNLAAFYAEQGDFAEAESLFRHALAIAKKSGDFHVSNADEARTLGNLAIARMMRGDLTGAEPLLKHALGITTATLGIEHPDARRYLGCLATMRD